MRKILLAIGILLLSVSIALAATQWRNGTGANTILGDEQGADIDSASYNNIVKPLDTMLSKYREGCEITYLSASTLTVGDGQVMLSNADGSIRLMQSNTSNTTVTWSDLDTGSEAASTTYYIYAYQATVGDSDFDVAISASSSTPSGITYYRRLGSFYNDSDSNITYDDITNDNDYYALKMGDWVSKSVNVPYRASTDGYLTCYGSAPGVGSERIMNGLTDSSNPPTTIRVVAEAFHVSEEAGPISAGFTLPVKRGDYYEAELTGDVSGGTYAAWWIPSE